jgi:hypothetical protein
MRTLLIALVLLLPAAARASDDKVEVPFLFTDDQAAPQADPSQSIKPTDVLRTDAYLNAPMTRLEYMLTRMEMRLNNETTVAVIKGELGTRFEPAWRQRESIEGFAGYSDRTGRVFVGYRIEGVGRPRSPMREACEWILTRLVGSMLPFESQGYTLHNTLLGVLSQKDEPLVYTPMLAKLANQFVHRVSISSHTEEGKVHHTLACQRTAKDGPITYQKFSFRLK